MSAISADYEDLLLGKPDQLDTRAADLVTAADAIEQATAALRGLIDDQTSLSTDALAETASEVARSLSKAAPATGRPVRPSRRMLPTCGPSRATRAAQSHRRSTTSSAPPRFLGTSQRARATFCARRPSIPALKGGCSLS